jgi:hypothetical protein
MTAPGAWSARSSYSKQSCASIGATFCMTAIAKARSSRSLFPIPRLIGPGLGSIRSTAGQTYLARTCGAGDPPRREQRLSLIETDSALAGVYAIAGVTRDRSGRSDYRSEPGSSPRIQFTKPLTSPSWPSVRSAGGQRSNPSSIPDNRRKQAGFVTGRFASSPRCRQGSGVQGTRAGSA